MSDRAELPASVTERLARLTPDQRAAATAPVGPVLCIAPAGSGKTTTLVARIAWLVATGTPPERIAAIAFNKRAADELAERLGAALAPIGVSPGAVRVRTFHALGREILQSAGRSVEPLVDRSALLSSILPHLEPPERRRLDTAISRLKLDLRVSADAVAADPEAGPLARGFVAYALALAATGGLDFDDLVAEALTALESNPGLLAEWRRSCHEVLVDEVQDVDRSQLELALLLSAPDNRIFLVGDDDQSIYGWRLADVRRVLDLAGRLPGLRRLDLVTNFRCPGPVVERAVRLVEVNRERFAKRIVARPDATGRLVLAPDASDDDDRARRVLLSWRVGSAIVGRDIDTGGFPDADQALGTLALLARTNRELLPAAAVALELGIPFRADRLVLLLEDPRLDPLLDALVLGPVPPEPNATPLLIRLGALRAAVAARGGSALGPSAPREDGPEGAVDDLLAAMLGWAASFRDTPSFVAAVRERRATLGALRRDDARLSLATAHGTKGLEFDHVAVIGMDADRFPSRRTLDEADDPDRAIEEERRLAYVAWTRARRSLTLVYDPAAPSEFLRDAFDDVELGIGAAARARGPPSASSVVPVERSNQSVDCHEARLGDIGRQRVPDGVLRTVGGPHPDRRPADLDEIAVPEQVRQWGEDGQPAGSRPIARCGDHRIDRTSRGQGPFVDGW